MIGLISDTQIRCANRLCFLAEFLHQSVFS